MDYANWLTKQQAADTLNVSTKTIETLAKAGQLQQARWRRPETGQTLAVYHPGDVDRMVQDRRPGPATGFLVPDPGGNGNGDGHHQTTALAVTSPVTAEGDPLRALATVVLTAWAEGQKGPKAAKAEKLVLTLDEAAADSGWSRTYLLRKIREKALPAEKDGGWKIRRRDLEVL